MPSYSLLILKFVIPKQDKTGVGWRSGARGSGGTSWGVKKMEVT